MDVPEGERQGICCSQGDQSLVEEWNRTELREDGAVGSSATEGPLKLTCHMSFSPACPT